MEAVPVESESAQLAMKDALITETLGDVVKLRRQVQELDPLLRSAIEQHAEIGQQMISRQREQFAAMAASEIERINAEYSIKADDALAGAACGLRTATETIKASSASTTAIVLWTAGIASFVGALVGSSVFVALSAFF